MQRGPGAHAIGEGGGHAERAAPAERGEPPLRLLFVADPGSVHVQRWARYFAARGHRVTLLDPLGASARDVEALTGTPGPGAGGQVVVERIAPIRGALGLRPTARRRELRDVVRRLRPDVVHAHYVRRFGWLAALSGFHPYVVSPWGSDLLRARRWNLRTRAWNWRALHGADLVTVTTRHMRRAAIAAGAREERVEIVQHGVDTAAFAPGPPAEELRRRLGAQDRPIVFSPRAIRPLYHHQTIVDAFALATRDAVLVMSAAGADPEHLARIRADIGEAGLIERVHLLDAIPHQEMPAYLRLADVVISVPESDSFPVSLLEAMAVGRPVIASDLPPAREVLEDLAPEALVPVGDVAATASALTAALGRSQAERAGLGVALRAWVVANADYEANMRKMERLYRQLAGKT